MTLRCASAGFTKAGNIAVVSIENSPVNALTHHVRLALGEALAEANADIEIEAIVLIGADKRFCAEMAHGDRTVWRPAESLHQLAINGGSLAARQITLEATHV
jgi:enoyl-CoA hydratase/carnithine racemase